MTDRSEAYFQEMTEGNVNKLIIQLAIPSTISMLITNFYNMADTAFVGRLGTSASGAVGIVFGFMAFVQAVGFLFWPGQWQHCCKETGAEEK